ncbi:MAG: hypothetical protein ACFFCW_00530 [Candidatus Hodarchaeota archaeon]
MLSNIIQIFQLLWDILKNLWPFIKRLKDTRNVRNLITQGESPPGTPAHEVALLIAAMENPIFYVGWSNFPRLLKIRRALWTARLQLSDLAEYALAARGEFKPETISALSRIVGKWETDALPLLHSIVDNPTASVQIQDLAKIWINRLKKAKFNTPPNQSTKS